MVCVRRYKDTADKSAYPGVRMSNTPRLVGEAELAAYHNTYIRYWSFLATKRGHLYARFHSVQSYGCGIDSGRLTIYVF